MAEIEGQHLGDHVFIKPERQVKNLGDMLKWKKSKAYRDYMGFINAVNTAVKAKDMSRKRPNSKAVEDVVNLLDTLDSYIEQYPPIDQPQRFGNRAFKSWLDHVRGEVDASVKKCLSSELLDASTELGDYLTDAFGNSTRIDYGTGHEAAFLAFLCCLCKLRVLTPDDYESIAFCILPRYLDLVRKLLKLYRMEPAGSQGVWGLDDFHFIPFIWGSSQLIGHANIEPNHIPDADMCERRRSEFIFFEAIAFINEVKKGPFAEHSNTLWGISAVATWSKVNSGLIKMYKEERRAVGERLCAIPRQVTQDRPTTLRFFLNFVEHKIQS